MRTEINYFARNGAVVRSRDRDNNTYRVFVPHTTCYGGRVRNGVILTLDWVNTRWDSDHGDWPHTDEEAERIDDLARAALREYLDLQVEKAKEYV